MKTPPNFWTRLESFIKKVQVGDMPSAEEKEMILKTCHENKNEPIMKDAFNQMMGYPMETIEALAQQAKEINRNRIVELNQRDLKDNGIERD